MPKGAIVMAFFILIAIQASLFIHKFTYRQIWNYIQSILPFAMN